VNIVQAPARADRRDGKDLLLRLDLTSGSHQGIGAISLPPDARSAKAIVAYPGGILT